MLGVVEGHYAGEALLSLHRIGVLEALAAPRHVRTLAKAADVDPDRLKVVLEFVSRVTSVVVRDQKGRYRLGPAAHPEVAFQLEKFIGAYGASIHDMARALRHDHTVSGVDEVALSAAFVAMAGVPSVAAEMLRKIGAKYMLDLGCGPASLLVELSLADPYFRGIGIDSSPVMCRAARSHVRSAAAQNRVRIVQCDAKKVAAELTPRDLAAIDVILGRSLLNALFRDGEKEAVAFLKMLRALMPGRTGVFVDYYGELNKRSPGVLRFRQAQLQDLAQLASGQGIPPSNRTDWDCVFRKAGCVLVAIREFRSDDIRWFIRQIRF
jgi:SAM-dependent methyltransferase